MSADRVVRTNPSTHGTGHRSETIGSICDRHLMSLPTCVHNSPTTNSVILVETLCDGSRDGSPPRVETCTVAASQTAHW